MMTGKKEEQKDQKLDRLDRIAYKCSPPGRGWLAQTLLLRQPLA
jgi:hypothetical protein